MQLGTSDYSFRNELNSKKYSYSLDSLKKLKATHPDLLGFETVVDLFTKYVKDDSASLMDLKKTLNQAGFQWYAFALSSGSMPNCNLVPFYHDFASYRKGFERDREFRIGSAAEWIENAAALGIKLMRIDPMPYFMNHKINYSMAFDFNIEENIAVYSELTKMAAEHDITIGIENHGGFASDPNVLRKLFAGVPELKFVYDIGNVTDAERYHMAEEFADRICYVHAKTYVFNPDGEESYMDYGKVFSILKDKGYNGWVSVEFEGPGDGDTGVARTIQLIKKYM